MSQQQAEDSGAVVPSSSLFPWLSLFYPSRSCRHTCHCLGSGGNLIDRDPSSLLLLSCTKFPWVIGQGPTAGYILGLGQEDRSSNS